MEYVIAFIVITLSSAVHPVCLSVVYSDHRLVLVLVTLLTFETATTARTPAHKLANYTTPPSHRSTPPGIATLPSHYRYYFFFLPWSLTPTRSLERKQNSHQSETQLVVRLLLFAVGRNFSRVLLEFSLLVGSFVEFCVVGFFFN